ncbi:MAG TPA: TIGR03086 family metal-binding protein [Microthrixaceae bacterium]|nr:TIGR03086 family metal-binding protein [Microthrixaceae bacterium]
MDADYLELYERASGWANEKVRGASKQLDASTPCDDWDVRTLLSHMLDTQRYFLESARGEDASPPAAEPPQVLSDDPVADFDNVRSEMLEAFDDPRVQEKTGPALGIAFSDQLLHGWDVARATKQDATMPADLAQSAYDTIHGRFTDEQRKGVFKPELEVGADASAQDKLLAYTGRDPSAAFSTTGQRR